MQVFDSHIYVNRRKVLKQKLKTGKVLFLGNELSSMNYEDNHFHFVQDSTYLYYFGIDQPGLAAIIDVDNDEDIIFGNELSVEDIIWTGPLPTLVERAGRVGVDMIKPSNQLAGSIDSKTFFLPPYRPEHEIKLSQYFNKSINEIRESVSLDLLQAISDQRSIKSEEELEQMDLACTFSGEAHLALMNNAKPGMKEHHLVGIFEKVGKDHDVNNSYPTICTINGQVLHNHFYGNQLSDGKMVLVDAGLNSPMKYAGDLTRTFPVSRQFSSIQRDIYNIVYEGFMHAIEIAKPGTLFRDLHIQTAIKLTEGMISLGFMKGKAEEAVANGAHTLFFPHGLGHLIGLDVHDLENFGEEHIGYTPDLQKSKEFGLKSLRLGKALLEGFTVTIEPGIYFIPELMEKKRAERLHMDFINYDKFESFRDFGGIRIEDNFVMRAEGFEKLGAPLVRTVKEIEEARYQAFA